MAKPSADKRAEAADGWKEDTDLPAVADSREVTLNAITGATVVTAKELRELSFEGIMEAMGGSLVQASDVIETDQFGPILENKDHLVGKPFFLVHWEFHDGDFGEFVSMYVLTESNERYIVNDGSTGIYRMLRRTTNEKGIDSGVFVRKGLTRSDYTYENEQGKQVPATTYYIDTSL